MTLPTDMRHFRAEDYEPLPDPVVLFDLATMAGGVLLLMWVLF